MNRHNQHPAGSAFKAHGDRREYNVYIETAAVEDAWCRIPEWPLSSQVVPLLVSLEIALKIRASYEEVHAACDALDVLQSTETLPCRCPAGFRP